MVARVLLALLVVPAFAVANDTVLQHVEGWRYCLSSVVAALSASNTQNFCLTVGSGKGALPQSNVGGLVHGLSTPNGG